MKKQVYTFCRMMAILSIVLFTFASCGGKKQSFETVDEAEKNLSGTVWTDKAVQFKVEFSDSLVIGYAATVDSRWKNVGNYHYELKQKYFTDNQKPYVVAESIKDDYGIPYMQIRFICSIEGNWAAVLSLSNFSQDIYLWQTSERDFGVGDKSVLLVNKE